MSWEHFIYFAIASVLLWAVGAWAAWRNRSAIAYSATILGLLVFFAFILMMWISLERPPLRTMVVLPAVGGSHRLFALEIQVDSVILDHTRPGVYLRESVQAGDTRQDTDARLAESVVCTSCHRLYVRLCRTWCGSGIAAEEFDITDNLVYVGLAFLTIGMLFGALWAKEAWGHYWSWDPKETWAAITWLAYLIYVHYRQLPRHRERLALWILIGSFVLLQMCWWGINYLPSAQGSSVHTYNISD